MASTARLTELESDLAEKNANARQLKEANELLGEVPDSEELLEMKSSLEADVENLKRQIAAEKVKRTPASATPVNETYPMSRNGSIEPAAPTPVAEKATHVFRVNDEVQAKNNRIWYPARITSVIGNATNPLFYNVLYLGTKDMEMHVPASRIRPLHPPSRTPHQPNWPSHQVAGQKRKADGSPSILAPTTSMPMPITSTNINGVIVAAPSINAALVQKDTKTANGLSEPKKKRKVAPSTKKLESHKSDWQAFQKSKGIATKSQFTTPDRPNARVGVTGSGQPMRKDQVRTRHVFNTGEPEQAPR
ncbi:hypothetical protein LTR66_011763 [Elasticomyces elasticus]|nr:hypothetical protein LTR66_011763 [Elasticomyces elasticus]